ncbi:MAG: hypothetical protein ACI8X5_004115, partial [Planctomycetota bacterium]
ARIQSGISRRRHAKGQSAPKTDGTVRCSLEQHVAKGARVLSAIVVPALCVERQKWGSAVHRKRVLSKAEEAFYVANGARSHHFLGLGRRPLSRKIRRARQIARGSHERLPAGRCAPAERCRMRYARLQIFGGFFIEPEDNVGVFAQKTGG